LPYREAIKNRYIGALHPATAEVEEIVSRSSAIGRNQGRNVLLVDDSIVPERPPRDVQMAACGARKVYFASDAPPVRFPIYASNMPTCASIATGAARRCGEIGADKLIYQDWMRWSMT